MAIAYGAGGGAANGTSSLSVAYPAGITAQQLLLLIVVNKYAASSPAPPAGWIGLPNGVISGGAGASGVDTGVVNVSAFCRVADGSESGNVTVLIPSGDASVGSIYRLTKASNRAWGIMASGVAQNTGNSASWSVQCPSTLGLATDDFLVTTTGINANTYTWAINSLTATGATLASVTERLDTSTSQGDDLGIHVATAACTAGAATAGPLYAMTATGALTTSSPAGATLFIRLREIANRRLQTGLTLGL